MRLLLDTHVFLWWRADAPELTETIRAALLDPENEVLVSAVVGWEIVIKRALHRLDFEGSVADAVGEEGFTPLPIRMRHVDAVADLPPLHADPFDRLLVAQALAESLTLVSADGMIRRYPGIARIG